MKKFMLVLLLGLIALTGCDDVVPTNRQGWTLYCVYDRGETFSRIECDSLQMISCTEAVVWCDGVQTRVFAEQLKPSRTK